MTRYRVIRDLEWKKTFITKAKKYNKPVVPVHISGRLSNRFYRIARLRKFLGIKMNLEMLLLAKETLIKVEVPFSSNTVNQSCLTNSTKAKKTTNGLMK